MKDEKKLRKRKEEELNAEQLNEVDGGRNSHNEPQAICHYCGKTFSVSEIEEHQKICSRNPMAPGII